MKILVCAHEAPVEPFDGFRGPVAALVERLRAAHEVRVLAVRAPDQNVAAASGMTLVERPVGGAFARAASAVRAMTNGRPRGVDALAGSLDAPLRDAIESFFPDVVHVTSGRLAGLARAVRDVPNVLAVFDALHLNVAAAASESDLLRAALLRGEVKRWERFEAAAWPLFDAVTVVSDEDARALSALAPAMPLHVIGAGVDAARFTSDLGIPRVPGRVVFHGVMDYAPNVAAALHLAREVFPIIRSADPSATLVIAGRDPAPAVAALGRLPGVSVTGTVADMRSVLSSGSVYVCAMRSGSGVKNKILEAASNGLACIATPLATRGLGAGLADAILVGEDPETLARLALRVLGDEALAIRLGTAGRDAVVAEHDWPAVVRAYETLYRGVIDRRRVATRERA